MMLVSFKLLGKLSMMEQKYKNNFGVIVLDSFVNPKSFFHAYSILKTFGLFLFILLSAWIGIFDLFFNKNFVPNSLYLEFPNYPKLGSILEGFLIGIYAILLMTIFLKFLLSIKTNKKNAVIPILFAVIYYSAIINLLMFPVLIGVSFINPQNTVLVITIESITATVILFIPFTYCILAHTYELNKRFILLSYILYLSTMILSGLLLP